MDALAVNRTRERMDLRAGRMVAGAAVVLVALGLGGVAVASGESRFVWGGETVALPDARIDINTAGAGELMLLPRIGVTLGARIVEDRERRGAYRRVEDLDRVKGIGPRTVMGLREYVAVHSEGAR